MLWLLDLTLEKPNFAYSSGTSATSETYAPFSAFSSILVLTTLTFLLMIRVNGDIDDFNVQRAVANNTPPTKK
ncbi:hypothetical protein GJ746_00030 [Klebsiella oxytoca]|uniref:Uncharacterized protein n=1 Tax=Klebsiella oxytoca TaxID=571 RepID=A0A6B8MN30_KLEOX|nr:hypothetical protein GJ746_00030 [Klebsiella oxytoca]